MGLLTGLIGAATGLLKSKGATDLIGGVLLDKLGRNRAKRDAASKFVDLRNAAIAGGFNPLTALEATGGAGFGDYSGHAPLASQEMITQGLAGMGDEISGDAARERARIEAETDLLKQQAREMRGSLPLLNTRSRAAVAVGPVQGVTESGTPWKMGDPYREGAPAFDRVGSPLTPAIAVPNAVIKADPDVSDAEILEQRYGDLVQWIGGVGILGADMWHNRGEMADAVVGGMSHDFWWPKYKRGKAAISSPERLKMSRPELYYPNTGPAGLR